MKPLSIVTTSLFCALMSAPAYTQQASPIEATIDNLRLGEYWYGAKISKKDLLGKVVLVELWGS